MQNHHHPSSQRRRSYYYDCRQCFGRMGLVVSVVLFFVLIAVCISSYYHPSERFLPLFSPSSSIIDATEEQNQKQQQEKDQRQSRSENNPRAEDTITTTTTTTTTAAETTTLMRNTAGGGKKLVKLFLCGDFMTGRGIDQVMPHSVDPQIYEGFMTDARGYVQLAERANGPVSKPVSYDYIWGDGLEELQLMAPDLRIINLETAVTTSPHYLPKGINYRMHPANIPCLTSAAVDCCVLANNHVLDWGEAGLRETLHTLKNAGIKTAGAGTNLSEAQAPAILDLPAGKQGRVLVFSFGFDSSGTPGSWAAKDTHPGVNWLPDHSHASVSHVRELVLAVKQPGDIVLASIHWGHNWGYHVPTEQRSFAHGLIDVAGVDLVHGHSSHHVKGIEVYRDHLILYGCGDLLSDYEGISGNEEFRGDLTLMYFPSIDLETGRLVGLEMSPTRLKHLRITHASNAEAQWLEDMLNREGRQFKTGVTLMDDNRHLSLTWEHSSSSRRSSGGSGSRCGSAGRHSE